MILRIQFGSFAFSGTRRRRESASIKDWGIKRERDVIVSGDDRAESREIGLLYLVFMEGQRPEAEVVLNAAQCLSQVTVSHRPDNLTDVGWAELLLNGMTFDISGFGRACSCKIELPRHVAGLVEQDPWIDGKADAIAISLGPHLVGGEGSLPILRGLLRLGSALAAELGGLAALVWRPAELAIAPELFAKVVGKWLEGGALPVEALIALTTALDQGLQSVGLAHFTGQELRLEPDLTEDPSNAERLAYRLLNQLALNGKVTNTEQMVGPDGTPLRIEPSGNGKYVRVWRS